jgi:hypothetical protein
MASQTPPSGTFAGRYTIERELGRGGTATVYLARDETTSTSVALKILRRELVESVAADRFLREFRMNAALRHPHIAPILDSGQFGADLYLVMPNMESGSLRTLLDRERQLSVEAVVEIVRGIGSALQHAHERGLIHRDVKPENILFSDEQAYLSDFGIARAVERVTGDSTTSSGIIRGTPAYMSPEQASGDHNFDGRSDQFSFACVVYEMLAGLPAFHGPTQESTIALRFKHAPREISVYRPGISQAIERVIQKAMSLSPADRYANMGGFVKAFDAAVLERPRANGDRQLRHRDRWIGLAAITAGIAVLAAAAAFGGVEWLQRIRIPKDSTQVVVLPFETNDTSKKGPAAYELFHTALRRWQGLHVVSLDRTIEALSRRRPGRLTADEMRSIATSLGARRYVVVRPAQTATSRALFAEYRDTEDGSLREGQLELPSDPSKVAVAYAALADSLVLRGASDSGVANQLGPRHLFATQAFIRAMNARQDWDLARADSELALALSLDPTFSRAYLWQAQQKSWREFDASTWIVSAEKALADSMALTLPERLMAQALTHMGHSEFPEACDAYRALTRTYPTNFAGWYGLGECTRNDHAVVVDARSPSRFRFRSSLQEAVISYVRSFQLIPSTYRGFQRNGYWRLRSLLFLDGNVWRDGRLLGDPRQRFYGVGALVSDTLALVPWPQAAVTSQRVSNTTSTAVVTRMRNVFDMVVTRWASVFPRSAGTKEAVAISLELRGEPSALDTMEAAERLTTDPEDRVRLAASRLSLSLKLRASGPSEPLARVAASADSLLRENQQPKTAEIAGFLAPVAAMTGRCALTGTLLRQTAPLIRRDSVPADIMAELMELQGHLSAGCKPRDAWRRLDNIATRLATSPAKDKEYMLLNAIVRAIVPPDSAWATRWVNAAGRTLRAERQLAQHHGDSARAELQTAARARNGALPGQVTAEAVVPEAEVWLMLGDTAGGRASLESALSTARQASSLMTDEPSLNSARLGFLIQAYALHASLLARSNPSAARQDAMVAATLWRNADPDLQSTVLRLREIMR